MAKVSTSISLEADVKDQAQSILVELGLDLSTAVGMFLRQLIRERSIPFTATLNVPNAVTLAAMDDAVNDRDLHGPFDSVSAMMEALNA